MKVKDKLIYVLIWQLGIVTTIAVCLVDEMVFDMAFIIGITTTIFLTFLFGTPLINGAVRKSQAKFSAIFFGVTGFRMALIIFMLLIYLISSALVFKTGIILILMLFFINMGFEIKIIYSKLRPDFKSNKNNEDAGK